MNLRLDKYLADAGCGTRSEVKKKIRKGMVTVDGRVIKIPDTKVNPDTQTVRMNDALISYTAFEYYMLNKPAGVVSAVSDPREQTVLDLITEKKRRDLFPVGRLDKDTIGLLLITNDGELAHHLLSPARHVDKVYEARIDGLVNERDIQLFREGIDIGEEKPCRSADLKILRLLESEHLSEIELTIREGRFHQVKRMFHAIGKEVLFLQRTRMGPLKLDETLRPGEYRMLTEEEIDALCLQTQKL